MAVTETISAYSTTANSNTPAGTDSVGPDLDNHLRDIKKNIRVAATHWSGESAESIRGAIEDHYSASPAGSVHFVGPKGS